MYGPTELVGREIKEEGYKWILVMGDGKATYAKVSMDGYTRALRGEPFEVWHPLAITPGGLAFLSASSKTIEPWFMSRFNAIANVHPAAAAELDEVVKKNLSAVQIFTEGQMPKTNPQGIQGIIKG